MVAGDVLTPELLLLLVVVLVVVLSSRRSELGVDPPLESNKSFGVCGVLGLGEPLRKREPRLLLPVLALLLLLLLLQAEPVGSECCCR